jgi:hypothetical protein
MLRLPCAAKKTICIAHQISYSRNMKHLRSIIGCLAALQLTIRPDTITLTPSADTAMMEDSPDNNFGLSTDLPVGGLRRTTASGTALRCRALLRFPLDQIQAGAQVTAVTVTISVTREPSGQVASQFELLRMVRDWTEGTEVGQLGAPASPGEATWLTSGFADWGKPGGGSGPDFAGSPSSSVTISALGKATFASTARLVSDVQTWVADPSSNFGWMLLSENESTPETARRIASRESAAANRPSLKIDFVPGTPPIHLTLSYRNASVHLSWSGGAPGYQVERKKSLSDAAWERMTDVISTTTAEISAPDSAAFYRVVGGL